MTEFGAKVPVRDEKGEVIGTRASEVARITRNTLGFSFGKDRNRRVVVALRDGDIIAVRPARRSRLSVLTITAQDLHGYLVRCEADRIVREKKRDRKERTAIRLAAKRQERAEKKMFRVDLPD